MCYRSPYAPSLSPMLRHSFQRVHKVLGDGKGEGAFHRFPTDLRFWYHSQLSQLHLLVTSLVVLVHSAVAHEKGYVSPHITSAILIGYYSSCKIVTCSSIY